MPAPIDDLDEYPPGEEDLVRFAEQEDMDREEWERECDRSFLMADEDERSDRG